MLLNIYSLVATFLVTFAFLFWLFLKLSEPKPKYRLPGVMAILAILVFSGWFAYMNTFHPVRSDQECTDRQGRC